MNEFIIFYKIPFVQNKSLGKSVLKCLNREAVGGYLATIEFGFLRNKMLVPKHVYSKMIEAVRLTVITSNVV